MDTKARNGTDGPTNAGRIRGNAFAVGFFVVVAGCMALCYQQAPQRMVKGVVETADGSSTEGACVFAVPLDHSEVAGQVACAQTNREGAFTLTLRPGRYLVRAKNENEGYPDPNFMLSTDSSAKFPEILVEHSDISGVHVTLGARGGVLEGVVRDATTQLPVVGAKITISDAQDPAAYVEVFSSKSGHFQFTVPNKLVSLSAAAPGYKSSRSQQFVLSGGRRQSVELDLESK